MRSGVNHINVGVAALIINKYGKLLLSLRGENVTVEQSKWEIPGGAVNFGETLIQALKREVNEEVGVVIEVRDLLHVCDHISHSKKQHWVSLTFISHITSGEPFICENEKCKNIGWYSIEDAKVLNLSKITRIDIEMYEKKYPNGLKYLYENWY